MLTEAGFSRRCEAAQGGAPFEITLTDFVRNAAARDAEKVAIVDGARSYSYEELARAMNVVGAALRARGVRRFDRVGVLLDKSWEAVVALLGVAASGAAFVPISTGLRRPQAEHVARDCAVKLLLTSTSTAPLRVGLDVPTLTLEEGRLLDESGRVEARLDERAFASVPAAIETDLGAILYTSGSTGKPKGIMLSHRNLVAGAQIVSSYLENTPEDRLLSVLPFHFDYGLSQLTTMLRVGGTLVLQRSLLPGDILRGLREHGITGLAGVPSVWTLLLQSERSLREQPLSTLRYISNSGGMIPSAHIEKLKQLLPTTKIVLMYGLTEAFRSTYLPPEEVGRGPSCIGKAIPDTEIFVVTPDGRECAPGEVGELVHRGPTVALGYWGAPEKTATVYRPNPLAPPELQAHDRVVYSGDLVRRDEDGYLYYVGRRDELIKVDGHRISPQELEELFHEDESVHEVAVFGRGDIASGQSIVAVLSLREGVIRTEEDLRASLRERAPPYMMPRSIVVLPALPKTSSGKIDRSELRRTYAVE